MLNCCEFEDVDVGGCPAVKDPLDPVCAGCTGGRVAESDGDGERDGREADIEGEGDSCGRLPENDGDGDRFDRELPEGVGLAERCGFG